MRVFVAVPVLLASAGTALAGGASGSGMVVLDRTAAGAFSMTGSSTVEIPARAVYVNSSASNAVKTVGNAALQTPDLFVVGGASYSGNSGCTGTTHSSVAPYADPMSGLIIPNASGKTSLESPTINSNVTVTISPGYYSNGISITGNANVTFSPGVYLIGGKGLKISSGAVSGEGVSFVMLSGNFDIAGCSSLRLSAPESGDLAGVVMVQPASNINGLSLAGGSETDISGTIYAPGATTTITGNSTLSGIGPHMGDLVVCNRVTMAGTGAIKIGKPTMPAISLPSMPLFD